jgi:hypothetical protein
MYVLSVDPGKMSGVCLLEWSGQEDDLPVVKFSVEVDDVGYDNPIDIALNQWQSYDSFMVVCERFTITAQTVRNSQAPYSLEQIGILKHMCRVNGYKPENITFQAPVDAKTMFSNESLKKIGTWHKGGDGHANDAIRHALLKLVKSGWKPKVLLK